MYSLLEAKYSSLENEESLQLYLIHLLHAFDQFHDI